MKTLIAIDNRAKHWYTIFMSEFGCGVVVGVYILSHGRDGDDVSYGGLRKMGFSRTKTLGYGGDCCDFHFFKKK